MLWSPVPFGRGSAGQPRFIAREPPPLGRDLKDSYSAHVGDIEEIAPAGELAEQVPGGAMGPVVAHIATPGLEVDRDPAVLGHGQDEEQLLEIRPVILVMPP